MAERSRRIVGMDKDAQINRVCESCVYFFSFTRRSGKARSLCDCPLVPKNQGLAYLNQINLSGAYLLDKVSSVDDLDYPLYVFSSMNCDLAALIGGRKFIGF